MHSGGANIAPSITTNGKNTKHNNFPRSVQSFKHPKKAAIPRQTPETNPISTAIANIRPITTRTKGNIAIRTAK